MIEVPLTQGKVALIDDEDCELIAPYKWRAQKHRRTFYAIADTRRDSGGWTTVKMHRLILGLTDPLTKADHISGDGLDNRRSNLRAATNAENARNRGANMTNTSGYKGVRAHYHRWQAQIVFNGKKLHIGTFDTPQEAARAYDDKAAILFGHFDRRGISP